MMLSSALKSFSPKTARRPRQTLAQLRRLQRLTGSVIMRPLDDDLESKKISDDGRDMERVAEKFIKSNDRLTSYERIEIYNRQYWYRLIDGMYEDFPGLQAIFGKAKFNAMIRAYLIKYPSASFTLRNLGSRLAKFLEEEPKWTVPFEQMALDMAKFEWAQIVAFDGQGNSPLTEADLAGSDPTKLRFGLQPYITLLDLAYPLDQFSLAVKKQGLRAEASNAVSEDEHKKTRAVRRPPKKRTFVVVHRVDNSVYFKRLEEPAFRLLSALSEGKTLLKACELVEGMATPLKIKKWFMSWTAMGWFCKRK
jgi:hypothetical protein